MVDDVTVVVTTFSGREQFVGRAVASAKGQARIVVVHDGDKPADHSYVAWWEGVYNAQTPYVAILHDDDWYEPTFIERTRQFLEDGIAWVATDALIHFPDGGVRPNLDFPNPCNVDAAEAVRFLSEHVISPSCVLMRREDALQSLLPGGIPGAPRRSVVSGPDLLYTMLAIRGRRVIALNEMLVNFTAHEGSATIAAYMDQDKTDALRANYEDARRFAKAVDACWQS